MKLSVLGCAGGIGGRERLTTSFMIDDDILLDAGTGMTGLGLDQLVRIDHVFITHAHLDHVAGLALLVDSVIGKRHGPVTVHASEPVIAILKKHLFNWALWPDFASIPDAQHPILRWQPIAYGVETVLAGRSITACPVNHSDGSSGYWVHNEKAGFLFTGDMASTPELWAAFRQEPRLKKVIVDCSFTNADAELARKSMHFCPQALLADIASMPQTVEFLIYHLKPGHEDLIMQELDAASGSRTFTALQCGDLFDF